MLFQLMNKDKVVATYEEEKRLDDYRYTEINILDIFKNAGLQIAKTIINTIHAIITPKRDKSIFFFMSFILRRLFYLIPDANDNIVSCENSSRVKEPFISPLCITIIRSDIPISSGISELIIMITFPCVTRSTINL